MASFSGSKSDVVGSGLATPCECVEDPNELRVLFISLDISRISSARCCELVDVAIVAFLLTSSENIRLGTRLKTASAKRFLLVQLKAPAVPGSELQFMML